MTLRLPPVLPKKQVKDLVDKSLRHMRYDGTEWVHYRSSQCERSMYDILHDTVNCEGSLYVQGDCDHGTGEAASWPEPFSWDFLEEVDSPIRNVVD